VFTFAPEDLNKIRNKDVKISKHFEGEDKSQSSYSNLDGSSIGSFESFNSKSQSTIAPKFGKKKLKKPSYWDYFDKFGEEPALIWLKYTTWKKNLKKESMGTIRALFAEEIVYFDYARRYYENLPTLRLGKHNFKNPPRSCFAATNNSNNQQNTERLLTAWPNL
jgi:hypothetical protein